jgi:hypothetical protein
MLAESNVQSSAKVAYHVCHSHLLLVELRGLHCEKVLEFILAIGQKRATMAKLESLLEIKQPIVLTRKLRLNRMAKSMSGNALDTVGKNELKRRSY